MYKTPARVFVLLSRTSEQNFCTRVNRLRKFPDNPMTRTKETTANIRIESVKCVNRNICGNERRKIQDASIISGGSVTDPELLLEALTASDPLSSTPRRPATTFGNKTLARIGDAYGRAVTSYYAWTSGMASASMTIAVRNMDNDRLAIICDLCDLSSCIFVPSGHPPGLSKKEKATAVEALIGTADVEGGHRGAEQCIRALDIEIPVPEEQ